MSSLASFNPGATIPLRPPRRLGGLFQPVRNLYLLYFPLSMTAMGLLCWLIRTDAMLAIGSTFLSLISVYMLVDVLVLDAPLRLTTLLSMTLGLGYGLGTANSWYTIPRNNTSLGEFMHHDATILTHTMGTVLFALSILTAAGEVLELPIFGEGFDLEIRPQAVLFISFGFVLELVAYASGALNFMGGAVAENGQVGVFSSFAQWLIGPLFAVSLLAALNAKTGSLKWYLRLLTAMQFFLQIPLGRRNLIYTVVLAILTLRLGRFRFNWSWTKRVVIGAVLAGFLYVCTIGFFYLRVAGYGHAKVGIFDRILIAVNLFQTKGSGEVTKAFSQNVQQRTFILGFLAEMEYLSTRFTPGYGQNLYRQTLSAIPSVLYPDKERNMNEEGLANDLFGTTYWDEANSVMTAGAIDFGLLGIIVYPLACALVLRSLVEIIGESLPTFVATFVILGTIGHVLLPENGLTDYIIIIRNGLLFSIVIWFFIALPAFRFRRPD